MGVGVQRHVRDRIRASSKPIAFRQPGLHHAERVVAGIEQLLEPFRRQYFLTGEINTPVADVPLKLQELKERYSALGGRLSHLDGVSIDFDDWHFNVRPSNTEPLLRLNLEALSHELMEEKRDEVLELVRA